MRKAVGSQSVMTMRIYVGNSLFSNSMCNFCKNATTNLLFLCVYFLWFALKLSWCLFGAFFVDRLDLFKALSEDGKNLLEFEEETGESFDVLKEKMVSALKDFT